MDEKPLNTTGLERKIKEEAEKAIKRIADSQMFSKCRYVAKIIGTGGRSNSGDSAAKNYCFSDDLIEIKYEAFHFGDEKLNVSSGGKIVFSVDECVNTPPKNPILVLKVDHKTFNILHYSSGEWEKRVEALYSQYSPQELSGVKSVLEIK